jgi:hypothetical protein
MAPAELLSAIEAGSRRINELATALTARIEAFEQWLNALPGRVETSLWIDDPAGDPQRSLIIELHRSGKRWILSYSWWHDEFSDPGDPIQWTPLMEAPVTVKIAAVRAFPQLLQRMVETQQKLAKQITEAQSVFDDFARQIEGIQDRER